MIVGLSDNLSGLGRTLADPADNDQPGTRQSVCGCLLGLGTKKRPIPTELAWLAEV